MAKKLIDSSPVLEGTLRSGRPVSLYFLENQKVRVTFKDFGISLNLWLLSPNLADSLQEEFASAVAFFEDLSDSEAYQIINLAFHLQEAFGED